MCLFVVLTLAMLGVQVWQPFPWWLTLVLMAAIALFVRHSYRTEVPYGWV